MTKEGEGMLEATKPNLPAERTQHKRGITPIDEEDRSIPRIKLIQALSPEIKDKIAEDGDLVNSLTKENYGKALKFVPIIFAKSRILFQKREEGGGILCSARDGKTGGEYGLCSACDKSKWNNQTPPECTTIINVISLIIGEEGSRPTLACVSFANTSYTAGRNLINVLSYKNIDTFNYIYDLYSEQKTNKLGTFNILRYRDLNTTSPDDLYKVAEKLFESFKVEKPEISEEVPF